MRPLFVWNGRSGEARGPSELNTGNKRRLRDYAVLAGGLNLGLATAFLLLPAAPIAVTVLISGFVGGNITLSWIFGVVLNY
jgi:hypothetical protein|tara:strand:- start:13653 stop:13895 length:243 start_codon:yes stop_codon:yes gene_type:complete